MKQQHLVVVTEQAVTPEQAMRMKEQLEERINIPITVLGNVRQVMLIESEESGEVDEQGSPIK